MRQKLVSRDNEIESILEIMRNVELYKENSENGLVILLNGSWGSGKSTFLEEFVKRIEKEENVELFNFYNAYENDCYDNAYIPFFASIASKIQLENKFTNFIKSVGTGAASGIAVCAFSITRSIFKNKLGVDINDVIDDLNDELSNFKDDYLVDYQDFCEYKKYVKEKMTSACKNNTQIFIIDELDRCKPNFAMETLEIVKHFFDIKNCIFIISVDKLQLEESIKAVYGYGINSAKYFSKLFDYQCNLLPINFYDAVEGLEKVEYSKELIERSTNLFNYLNISLRDSKKIFNDFISKFDNWTMEQSIFMLFLFILKYTDLTFYNAIIRNEYAKFRKMITENFDRELEKYNFVLEAYIGKLSKFDYVFNYLSRELNILYLPKEELHAQTYLSSDSIYMSRRNAGLFLEKFIPYVKDGLTFKETIQTIIG